MSLFRRRGPSPQVHIGDPRFDDWEVVADYEELETGLAFRDGLRELGLAAELTADHPLDRFSRGDIALRVPGGPVRGRHGGPGRAGALTSPARRRSR